MKWSGCNAIYFLLTFLFIFSILFSFFFSIPQTDLWKQRPDFNCIFLHIGKVNSFGKSKYILGGFSPFLFIRAFENENPIWKSHQRCWLLPLINWAFIMFKQLQTFKCCNYQRISPLFLLWFLFRITQELPLFSDASIKKREKTIIKILLFSCNRLLWVKTFTVFFDIWVLKTYRLFVEQLTAAWHSLVGDVMIDMRCRS